MLLPEQVKPATGLAGDGLGLGRLGVEKAVYLSVEIAESDSNPAIPTQFQPNLADSLPILKPLSNQRLESRDLTFCLTPPTGSHNIPAS